MSNMRVTRLQVDVIVQAALTGPLGARHWEPLTTDPNVLGRQLLFTGKRADTRSADEYTFEPLPISLTAVEIIKACSFYEYNRSKVPAVVPRLAKAMESHLPGYGDAPWGWDSDDVGARLDRPAPGSELPAPPCSALSEIADRLEELGFALVELRPTVAAAIEEQAGRTGQFHGLIVAKHGSSNPVTVTALVAKTPEVAARVFPAQVGASIWGVGLSNTVRRIGNVIVVADLSHSADPVGLVRSIDGLGPADDDWSPIEAPLASAAGGLLSGRTDMSLSSSAVVARTAPELEKVIAIVSDPEVKIRLRNVDLRENSVVVLPGVELSDVVKVDLVRSSTTADRASMTEDLVLTALPNDDQRSHGSVVVTPRMRRIPAYVRWNEPGAARFTGWWRNVGRLS